MNDSVKLQKLIEILIQKNYFSTNKYNPKIVIDAASSVGIADSHLINIINQLVNSGDLVFQYDPDPQLHPMDKLDFWRIDLTEKGRQYFCKNNPLEKLHVTIKFNKNSADFLNETLSLLEKREAEYSLMLGLCELKKEANQLDDKSIYASVYDYNQHLIGGMLITERSLVISEFADAILKQIADFLFISNIKIPAVVGPAHTSETFSYYWSQLTKKSYTLAMGQKIYQLDKVIQPKNFTGNIIVATDQYTELIAEWLLKFNIESLPHEPTTIKKTHELAALKISRSEIYLWLDADNKPVSMNIVSRPTQNGISISGVYTPIESRKMGYASSLVAATSQMMLDSGKKFCVLYTDIKNPTSNKIYQNIGYKEIATSQHYIFESERNV